MSNTVRDGTLKKVIIEQDGLDISSAGRGATSGFVKCSLCNVKSNKVYAFGRGFSMHLHALHPTEDHVLAVRDSALSLTTPGFSKNGSAVLSYKDTLPPACRAAREGRLEDLRRICTSRLQLQSQRDKYGSSALDWAAGEGNLDCVRYLVAFLTVADSPPPPPPPSPSVAEPKGSGRVTSGRQLQTELDAGEERGWRKATQGSALQSPAAAFDTLTTTTTTRRRDGKSCLHWSCRNGHIETTLYLLEHLYMNSSYYSHEEAGGTAAAAACGESLGLGDALTNVRTGDGTTPLQLAAYGGHLGLLTWLHQTYGAAAPHATCASASTAFEDVSPLLKKQPSALFMHSNNWGCLAAHFACMSPQCGPGLLTFFVLNVYEGSFEAAAVVFFTTLNNEGLTPVHKWLLQFEKLSAAAAAEFADSLAYLTELKRHLPAGITPCAPPASVESFVLERLRKCSHLSEEQKAGVRGLLPAVSSASAAAASDLERTQELYDMLGLDRSCSDADIKREHRAFALRYHPDKQAGKEGWERQAAGLAFSRMQDGYDQLLLLRRSPRPGGEGGGE